MTFLTFSLFTLLSSLLLVNAAPTTTPKQQESLCYRIHYNYDGSSDRLADSSYAYSRLVRPVNLFPSNHSLVTEGVCGGADAGDVIPEGTTSCNNCKWDKNGEQDFEDCSDSNDCLLAGSTAFEDCNGEGRVNAGSLFYAYNYPVQFTANTGYEAPDAEHIYFVQDSANKVWLVITHDRHGNDGGEVGMVLSSFGLTNAALAQKDDISDNKESCPRDGEGVDFWDCYAWDDDNKSGQFYWKWPDCCTDGLVLGPMPFDNFGVALEYTNIVDLFDFELGDYDPEAKTMNFVDVDFAVAERGVLIEGFTCVDYCASLTNCGECSSDAVCSWCDSTNECFAPNADTTCPVGDIISDGCCDTCDIDNCHDCSSTPGCGWCVETATCVSGNDQSPCQPCTTYYYGTATCPSPSQTVTATRSSSESQSQTQSQTQSQSQTPTQSQTATQSQSSSQSQTGSQSQTATQTPTPTASQSSSPTPTSSLSSGASASQTSSNTPSTSTTPSARRPLPPVIALAPVPVGPDSTTVFVLDSNCLAGQASFQLTIAANSTNAPLPTGYRVVLPNGESITALANADEPTVIEIHNASYAGGVGEFEVIPFTDLGDGSGLEFSIPDVSAPKGVLTATLVDEDDNSNSIAGTLQLVWTPADSQLAPAESFVVHAPGGGVIGTIPASHTMDLDVSLVAPNGTVAVVVDACNTECGCVPFLFVFTDRTESGSGAPVIGIPLMAAIGAAAGAMIAASACMIRRKKNKSKLGSKSAELDRQPTTMHEQRRQTMADSKVPGLRTVAPIQRMPVAFFTPRGDQRRSVHIRESFNFTAEKPQELFEWMDEANAEEIMSPTSVMDSQVTLQE